MNKDFVEKFKVAYNRAKELGFENYPVAKNNDVLLSWEEINTMIDAEITIPKEAIKNIEINIKHFFQSQENLKLIVKAAKKCDVNGGLSE